MIVASWLRLRGWSPRRGGPWGSIPPVPQVFFEDSFLSVLPGHPSAMWTAIQGHDSSRYAKPFFEQAARIQEAMRMNRCLVITADTGAGKSTDLPRLARGRVCVLQVRRRACMELSARVNKETGDACASGYSIGGETCREHARIMFWTVQKFVPLFAVEAMAYDTIIVDELHERSLEQELLLCLLKHRSSELQRDCNVVLTSATLGSIAELVNYFSCPHIHVGCTPHEVLVNHAAAHAPVA